MPYLERSGEPDLEFLQKNVRDLRLVRLPLQAHSLQIVAPAACATQVLYFMARYDGIACHE